MKYKRITIECSDYAAKHLEPLLKQLKYLGGAGSTRSILVDPHLLYDNEERTGKPKLGGQWFLFDGDGSDKIYRIVVEDDRIRTIRYDLKWRPRRWLWRIQERLQPRQETCAESEDILEQTKTTSHM